MKRIIRKALSVLGTLLVIVYLFASPVLAIGNPDSIYFGITAPYDKFGAWENVIQDGDMLFTGLADVNYASAPNDYTASEAFTFQLLNTDGTTVLYQIPVVNYQATMIGIYLTAAQVTASSITYGGAYSLRLAPNPTLFTPTEGTNQATQVIGAEYWHTGTLGYTKLTTASNSLRLQMIAWAVQLEAHDSPTGGYVVTVNGVDYINTTGSQVFLAGISGLDIMCPTLFQVSTTDINLTIGQYSYSTGTVSGTSGTNSLTGVGTDWTSITVADAWIKIANDINLYQITSASDATTIALESNLQSSPAGATYVIYLTGDYSNSLSTENQLGTTISNGITNLGNFFNVGKTGGGIIVMIGISLALVGTVWTKFHSALAAEAMGAVVLTIGMVFGILPMYIGMMIIILIVVLALIIFSARGIG